MQGDVTLPLQASDTIVYTYITLQLWDPQSVSYAALAALKLFLCSLRKDGNVWGMAGREHTQIHHFPPFLSPPCTGAGHTSNAQVTVVRTRNSGLFTNNALSLLSVQSPRDASPGHQFRQDTAVWAKWNGHISISASPSAQMAEGLSWLKLHRDILCLAWAIKIKWYFPFISLTVCPTFPWFSLACVFESCATGYKAKGVKMIAGYNVELRAWPIFPSL